jgi:predicted metal-binding membrane protein
VRRAAPTADERLAAGIGIAWILVALAHLSGLGARLHHDQLADGAPTWASIVLLLGGWELMLAAMMLPSCVPMIRHVRLTSFRRRRRRSVSLFLSGYLAVWTAFGIALVAGDRLLHHVAGASGSGTLPDGLVLGAALAVAAAWQFSPIKRRCLHACRSPGLFPSHGWGADVMLLRFGLVHGVFCVGACWALMLVMFALGSAQLAWMATLAVVILYEKGLSRGYRLVRPVGVMLMLLAAVALASPAVLSR